VKLDAVGRGADAEGLIRVRRRPRQTRRTVGLDEGDPLPDWRAFDAIVAMGGPMGAVDDDEHPWLVDEKRLIAEAVRSGLPFWGVCLGVQLLAASLGARVYPGPSPEVGLLPVTLTDEALADPVFAGTPRELLTLQWHGDTFDLLDTMDRRAAFVQNVFVHAGRLASDVLEDEYLHCQRLQPS
jgi:GMP synthase-like glutamine amidotransferase